MSDSLSNVPPSFKPIQHYLKTAAEHDKRDPVVAYYCRLYAMQKGMEIDKKSPESRNFLRLLMGHLEEMKVQLKDNEAIQSELVGQAHVENYAIKLFFYADTEDRKSNFGKNVVKAFYTSSMLFDVLTTFGELPEELEKSRKYAKWKAAYIHNCLKVGATPQPGPQAEAADELGISTDHQFQLPQSSASLIANLPPASNPVTNTANYSSNSASDDAGASRPYFMNQQINKVLPLDPSPGHRNVSLSPFNQPPAHFNEQPSYPQPSSSSSQPPQLTFPHNYIDAPAQPQPAQRHTSATNFQPKHEDFSKAMKFCKFANSALQYEDAPTAILNLTKALNIMKTGSE
ncbi:hypothetical protein HELRODRAFT_186287 [Helobdella robusta]|uniref:Vta1/callose synthase N-terminal domain-containing protein n=1 Tax=Helobdella robusta TaxID=6412 RepID=T1FNX3_HELRO|nr:hypothetical protein HELRODRAFT_186287 [Helobdella robusta]ESO09762.1 hypothetical protein HELRODRAFT_186287 [Helobdella robusta]